MKTKLMLSLALILGVTLQAQANECGETTFDYGLTHYATDQLMDNGPGKPGPRRLVTDQIAHMVSVGQRRLVQATAMDIDTLTLDISVLPGSNLSGKTEVVVCKTNPQGQATPIDTFDILGLKGAKKTYQNLRNQRVSLHLKGKNPTGQSRLRINVLRPTGEGKVWEPNRVAPRTPIKGFVDLHNHQAADLAFAGGWYWGSHREGPLQTRLPQCDGHSHATLQLPGGNTGQALIDPHPRTTHGAPHYQDWPRWNDIKHQQVSAQWLKQAHQQGLNVVMVSLVSDEWLSSAMIAAGKNNPAFAPSDMESVKRQINSLKAMDEKVDWYTIVRDPWEARRAIAKGQLAVFLQVEVSNLMPDSDGPWMQQLHDLYDMGVRSIQLAHETNTRFSGAAYHRDVFKAFGAVKNWFNPEIPYASKGDAYYNPVGLSDEGRAFIKEMIRLNMLLDITHLPLKTHRQMYQMVSQDFKYYPLFNSHTRMAELLMPAQSEELKEFVTTAETLEYVRKTGGMLGLRTGEEPMKTYQGAVSNNCDGSLRSWLQFYEYADDRGVGIGFGSDFNGFITQMSPRYGKDACANAPAAQRSEQIKAQGVMPKGSVAYQEYQQKGLAHVGLLPAVIEDMKALGVDTTNIDTSAEQFLNMWERAYDPERKGLP